MYFSKCYLCGGTKFHTRTGQVRDNNALDILECDECGLVFLSDIEHINNEHYAESGMHGGKQPNVDMWLKQTEEDDERRFQSLKSRIVNKSLLDFGSGVGGFLNKAKTVANNVAGIELDKAVVQSYKDRDLKLWNKLEDASKTKWDLITSFHVVEHLKEPAHILRQLSQLLKDDGMLIIEVPNSNDVLLTLYNSNEFQKFTYWSQHLYLFNSCTLTELAKQAGLRVHWLKHIQRYPLSNHLYWLSQGKPGGHEKWDFMNNAQLESSYEAILASSGMTDTIIAGLHL